MVLALARARCAEPARRFGLWRAGKALGRDLRTASVTRRPRVRRERSGRPEIRDYFCSSPIVNRQPEANELLGTAVSMKLDPEGMEKVLWRFPSSWIVLVIVGFLVFGAKRMPDAARGLGRSLRIFKAETKGLLTDDQTRPHRRSRSRRAAPRLCAAGSAGPASSPVYAAPVQQAPVYAAPVQQAPATPPRSHAAPVYAAPVAAPVAAPAEQPVPEHRDAQ